MNNILSDFEHVFSSAVHIFEYIVCRVMCTGSKFLYIYISGIYRTKGWSFVFGYDLLHTDAKGYIIMCKLIKLAFFLCCGLIDPSNVGVAVGIRQSIIQHSLNCYIYIARFGVYRKKG